MIEEKKRFFSQFYLLFPPSFSQCPVLAMGKRGIKGVIEEKKKGLGMI
jgi:hypothetical protein